MVATTFAVLLLAAGTPAPSQAAPPPRAPAQRNDQNSGSGKATGSPAHGFCNKLSHSINSCSTTFGPSAAEGTLEVSVTETGRLILKVTDKNRWAMGCTVDGSATDSNSEGIRKLTPVLFAVREGRISFDIDPRGRCTRLSIRRPH